MAYDIYPAVDETYNFPQLIRQALVQSTDVQSALTASKNLAKSELQTEKFTPIDTRFTGIDALFNDYAAVLNPIPVVSSPTDLAVTAVASARTVAVAAGSAISAFLKFTLGAPQNVVLTPPGSGGKWYAISINRQWLAPGSANTAVLVADDLAVTDGTGTIPTAIPAAARTAMINLPNQVNTNGGSAGQRQVLAAVYVRSADTTLTIFDLRAYANGSRTPTAMNFWAAGHIGYRHMKEGGLISVGQFSPTGGGFHVRSVWQKQNTGFLFPVGDVVIDENGSTGPYIGSSVVGGVAEALRVLLFSMTELVFDGDISELADRYRGLRFQYQTGQQKMVLKPTDKTRLVMRNNGTSMAIPSGTFVALPWDQVIMDNYGMANYGGDNRRIKLPFRGRYRVICHFALGGGDLYNLLASAQLWNAAGDSQNSDPPQIGLQNQLSDKQAMYVSEIYNDTPGRSMYFRVFQNTGGMRNVTYGNYPLNSEIVVEWMGDNNVGG